MAYVTKDRSKGQVIILAGFLIAIGIVVVAVLLNSLIFAQDLSTRDTGTDDRQVNNFYENTEKAALETANVVGQEDLFDDTSDVEDNFEEAMEVYGDEVVFGHGERHRSVEVTAPTVDGTSWFVGQRGFYEMTHRTGDRTFNVTEGADVGQDGLRNFTLVLEAPGFISDDEFSVLITDQDDPPGDPGSDPVGNPPAFGEDWQIAYSDDFLGGQAAVQVNATGEDGQIIETVDGEDIDNANDNITIEINPADGEGCISIDGGECSDDLQDGGGSDQSLLVDESLEDLDVNSITVVNEDGMDGEYWFEFDGDAIDDADDITGPCEGPCVEEPVDDIYRHATLSIEEAEFEIDYFDPDARYTNEIVVGSDRDRLQLEGWE